MCGTVTLSLHCNWKRITRACLRVQVNEVQHLIERISLCVEEVKLRHSTISTEINPPICEYIEFVFTVLYALGTYEILGNLGSSFLLCVPLHNIFVSINRCERGTWAVSSDIKHTADVIKVKLKGNWIIYLFKCILEGCGGVEKTWSGILICEMKHLQGKSLRDDLTCK